MIKKLKKKLKEWRQKLFKKEKLKTGTQPISPRFNRWVFWLFIVSLVIIISYFLTDHLPAWSLCWGNLFETANNIALSFVVTTIFYRLTVFCPEKKRYEQKSIFLQIDKKKLDREINYLYGFIVGNAEKRCPGTYPFSEKIDIASVGAAQEIFSKIPEEDPIWQSLHKKSVDLKSNLEIFCEKYEDYLSHDLAGNIRTLLDSSLFEKASTWIYLFKQDKFLSAEPILPEFFHGASELFVNCTNLMDNAKPEKKKSKKKKDPEEKALPKD